MFLTLIWGNVTCKVGINWELKVFHMNHLNILIKSGLATLSIGIIYKAYAICPNLCPSPIQLNVVPKKEGVGVQFIRGRGRTVGLLVERTTAIKIVRSELRGRGGQLENWNGRGAYWQKSVAPDLVGEGYNGGKVGDEEASRSIGAKINHPYISLATISSALHQKTYHQ